MDLLKTPIDIWNQIVSIGEIDENYYDKDLIFEMKYLLGFQPDKDLKESLKYSTLSNEQFLSAFFKIIEPFSKMMEELLLLFTKIGVNQTNNNLDIEFNFENQQSNFRFNIEEFKLNSSILNLKLDC